MLIEVRAATIRMTLDKLNEQTAHKTQTTGIRAVIYDFSRRSKELHGLVRRALSLVTKY
jgi:hypothetical protein